MKSCLHPVGHTNVCIVQLFLFGLFELILVPYFCDFFGRIYQKQLTTTCLFCFFFFFFFLRWPKTKHQAVKRTLRKASPWIPGCRIPRQDGPLLKVKCLIVLQHSDPKNRHVLFGCFFFDFLKILDFNLNLVIIFRKTMDADGKNHWRRRTLFTYRLIQEVAARTQAGHFCRFIVDKCGKKHWKNKMKHGHELQHLYCFVDVFCCCCCFWFWQMCPPKATKCCSLPIVPVPWGSRGFAFCNFSSPEVTQEFFSPWDKKMGRMN